MFRLFGNPKRLCTGLTRRDLLHIGGLGAFGLRLTDALSLASNQPDRVKRPSTFGRARSCILIYKYGSPPQHETFDPKPAAPLEVRGEFKAIATKLPGVRIGEYLPRVAGIMDRLTVVRSLTHPYPLHGTVYATTGIPEVDTKIEAIPRHPRQWPYIGSIVDYLADQRGDGDAPGLPRNVAIPFVMGSKNEYPPLAGPYGAMLGSRYDPVYTDFSASGLKKAPEIRPGRAFHDPYLGIRSTDRLELAGGDSSNRESPLSRLDLRGSLLAQFDQARREAENDENFETFGRLQRSALSLLSTGKLHRALDYSLEPEAIRNAYGMTLFGQSCLAARRLVEAGTKFVTVIWDAYGLNAGSWDTHHNHFERLRDYLLPVFDQAFSSLILDLERRGMLDETLVLVISEHGRTPLLDRKAAGGGRDHWSRAYSQVYAGGGIARGKIVGATDKLGGDVLESPISPKDILATAFHLLGIDPDTHVPDREGRPRRIAGNGELRPELLG